VALHTFELLSIIIGYEQRDILTAVASQIQKNLGGNKAHRDIA
jgi:hypothetical protein